MSYRALIVDDEPLARMRLRSLLEPYASEINVVDEAASGEQAIAKIRDLCPDVVFLDIQMPDMDAFEVLQKVDADDMSLIVFTTAYENFALRAFEENTVDYLLKPVDPDRLAITMEKLRKRFPEISPEVSLPSDFSWDKFRSMINPSGFYLQRIQVKLGDRILLVNIDEVVRFHSEEKYTVVHTLSNQYIIDTTLVELEKKLSPQQFVRIHRSHLVAIDYIAEIRKAEAGRMCVVLRDRDRTQLLVSRNFVKMVRSL